MKAWFKNMRSMSFVVSRFPSSWLCVVGMWGYWPFRTFLDYTAIEFARMDMDYLKKAIGRLEEFLNDPVIKAAKLNVKLGMVSSMKVIIGK